MLLAYVATLAGCAGDDDDDSDSDSYSDVDSETAICDTPFERTLPFCEDYCRVIEDLRDAKVCGPDPTGDENTACKPGPGPSGYQATDEAYTDYCECRTQSQALWLDCVNACLEPCGGIDV
ncbi:hypothetical protein K8I61_01480 [bacterium]|nr:hypothetical protein [bacterium]